MKDTVGIKATKKQNKQHLIIHLQPHQDIMKYKNVLVDCLLIIGVINYVLTFLIYTMLYFVGANFVRPKLSITKLQETGRPQVAPTRECVEYSIKKPSPRGEGGNAVDG